MEEDRIPENERYQMEQIRELELEELQVEEVDHDAESSDDEFTYRNSGGASASGEFTYDTSLAALHTYLGEVEDTHNRLAFLDGGAVLKVPLFYLEGVVLFPEATLPLRLVLSNLIAAVERALRQVDAPYTIGVIRVYKDNGRIKVATTGTTAEIRQYRRLEDGSVNVVTRGQQRFRLKRRWMDVEGSPCGEIQIIKEDMPLRTPKEAVGRLTPLSILRSGVHTQIPPINASLADQYGFGNENDSDAMSEESFEGELSPTERRLHQSALVSCDTLDDSTSSDDENIEQMSHMQQGRSPIDNFRRSFGTEKNKEAVGVRLDLGKRSMPTHRNDAWKKYSLNQFREVPRAFWPSWVYHMYDSYSLAQRAAGRWKEIVRAPSMDCYITKPDLLSFHIASKMPVSESARQELLEIDGTSYRLRREIELLESFDCIRCKTCETLIAKRRDMLVMSSEGPLGAYVNPHGFVHEIMTLFKAIGVAVIGDPEKEFSWFPGYAWSIAECATCETQLGWLFTATKKKLKPRSFWGIRSSQVADGSK